MMDISSELEKIKSFIPRQADVLNYEVVKGKIHFTYEYEGKFYKSALAGTLRGRRRKQIKELENE